MTTVLAGVLLVAMNMRPAFTSVGPVLADIRVDFGLPGSAAALLTGLPVISLGVLSLLAPLMSRRLGLERAIGVALLALLAGLALRVVDGFAGLLAGTVLVGGAIASMNVLLPVIVKRDFPDRAGRITGMYTAAMAVMASVAVAATIPIGTLTGLGWRGGLGFWALPVVLALIAWAPHLRNRSEGLGRLPGGVGELLRDPLAWQVTFFLGLQSLGFYAVVAWLPSVYRDQGIAPSDAGLLAAVVPLAAAIGGLTVPARAARARDQRAATFLASIGTAVGLAGLAVAPLAAPLLWVLVIGISQGAGFPLALTLVVLRSRTPAETQRLSAMAQSLGYSIAALGPLLAGAVHDATGGWTASLGLLALLTVGQAVTGLWAGRARFVRSSRA